MVFLAFITIYRPSRAQGLALFLHIALNRPHQDLLCPARRPAHLRHLLHVPFHAQCLPQITAISYLEYIGSSFQSSFHPTRYPPTKGVSAPHEMRTRAYSGLFASHLHSTVQTLRCILIVGTSFCSYSLTIVVWSFAGFVLGLVCSDLYLRSQIFRAQTFSFPCGPDVHIRQSKRTQYSSSPGIICYCLRTLLSSEASTCNIETPCKMVNESMKPDEAVSYEAIKLEAE